MGGAGLVKGDPQGGAAEYRMADPAGVFHCLSDDPVHHGRPLAQPPVWPGQLGDPCRRPAGASVGHFLLYELCPDDDPPGGSRRMPAKIKTEIKNRERMRDG